MQTNRWRLTICGALLLGGLCGLVAVAPVLAQGQDVPRDVLIDEADLIVLGKITDVKDGGFVTLGPRKSDHIVKHDVAVIEVARILKAPPGAGKLTTVLVGQPAKGEANLADILFQPGQQGIWLLSKDSGPNKVFSMKNGVLLPDPDRDVFWAKQPGQFLKVDTNEKKIAAQVDARAKLPGGKAVDGLVARSEVVDDANGFLVRFSLRNVSEKPIVVCDYVAHRPLGVQWTGPEDEKHRSNHYAWLAAAFLPAVSKDNFVTIPPGGVRFVGPRGAGSSLVFRAPGAEASAFENRAPAGKNRVTVSYTNKDDGKKFDLPGVWTGTVTANEVTTTVK